MALMMQTVRVVLCVLYSQKQNNSNIMEHAALCYRQRSSELVGQREMYFGTVCDVRLFKQSIVSFLFLSIFNFSTAPKQEPCASLLYSTPKH